MNITDVKSRLKYYYFIPLNQLESELKNLHSYTRLEKFSTQNNPEILTGLLDDIYSTVFKYSRPYSNFFNPDSNGSTFFGEGSFPLSKSVPLSSYYLGAAKLINLSIFHHCIIQSFYKNISLDNICREDYHMSADNYSFFEYGFTTLCKFPRLAAESKHSNARTKRALYSQRYHQFIKQPDDHYSKRLLELSFGKLPNKTCNNNKKNPSFQVTPYLNRWAIFLYSSKAAHHLDKALIAGNSASLLNIYNSLCKEKEHYITVSPISLHINPAQTPTDKLLASYPLEITYGFQTFTGLADFLLKIEKCFTFNNIDYSPLLTDSFFSTLEVLYQNPLVYNRHFLVRYACDAIMNGNFAKSDYLTYNANTLMHSSTNQVLSLATKVNSGLTLLEQYLNITNNLVIPLITDLWDYACNVLELKIEVFQQYIDNYYSVITNDFCTLTAEDISSFYLYKPQDLRLHLKKMYLSNKTDDKNIDDSDYFKKVLPTTPSLRLKLEKLILAYTKDTENRIRSDSFLSTLEEEEDFNPMLYHVSDMCDLFCNYNDTPIKTNIENQKISHARVLRDLSILKPYI